MQKITHVAQMRAQYAYNRTQVLWLTGMSDEELAAMQYDWCMEWLKQYTGSEAQQLAQVISEPLIWKWWLNEWNRRDDRNILEALYNAPRGIAAYRRYKLMHAGCFMKLCPDFLKLESLYAVAVGQMIDEAKNPQ